MDRDPQGQPHPLPTQAGGDGVRDWLQRIGLLQPGDMSPFEELAGGVSCAVHAVDAAGGVVVKRGLPQLRVAASWSAKLERTLTEAAALRLVAEWTPDAVPAVIDVDVEGSAFVMRRAPGGWRPWKERLLAGDAQPDIGDQLGHLLGIWHRATWHDSAIAARFDDQEAFEQLRVDPYYRTVMRRRPELQQAVGRALDELLARRDCLVHGDYSPKNVLVGGDGLWVLDFEVAHVGNPAFDLAFMLHHLVMKVVHVPAAQAALMACAAAFVAAYRDEMGDRHRGEQPALRQAACLLLGRVDGKSPAEYLTVSEQDAVRRLGRLLLEQTPNDLNGLWVAVAEVGA